MDDSVSLQCRLLSTHEGLIITRTPVILYHSRAEHNADIEAWSREQHKCNNQTTSRRFTQVGDAIQLLDSLWQAEGSYAYYVHCARMHGYLLTVCAAVLGSRTSYTCSELALIPVIRI